MTPYYSDESVTLYHGDALAVLAGLPDASVDAVVTDPPYGLEFMGKQWDKFTDRRAYIRGVSERDAERAEEQDGLTARRRNAPESYVAGRPYQQWCESWARECLRVLKPGGHMLAFGGTRTAHRLASALEDAGFEVRDTIAWLYGSGFPKSLDVSKALDKRAGHWRGRAGDLDSPNGSLAGANTAAAAGWGTALKPAHEPIIVARKSLVGTVADNWLAHGTGALNIDGCRTQAGQDYRDKCASVVGLDSNRNGDAYGEWAGTRDDSSSPLGRWPTNVVLNPDAAATLDAQTGVTRSRIGAPRSGPNGDGWGMTATGAEYDDQGGASRFFPTFRYEAKASTDERPRVGEVAHPTVKPLDLMRWLVRLVTPPGGVVLEPFAGSGTTVEACIVEGFRCLAIEREADYLPLILARITKPIETVLGFEDSV